MALLFLLMACFPTYRALRERREALELAHPDLVQEGRWDEGILRYAAVGSPVDPALVFVHGSPGSWEAGAHLLDSPGLEGYYRISYDRPGFGGSDPGAVEPSLARQATALAELLDHLGVRAPVRLIGHSLGGAVIARFAMDYPDRTAGLVFVAGSVDPALERRLWYQRLAERRLVKRVIPAPMVWANEEIAPLGDELRALLPLWERVRAPVAIVHCEDDRLVPFQNVSFLLEHLQGREVRVMTAPRGGHAVLWSDEARVVEAIRWLDAAGGRTAITRTR